MAGLFPPRDSAHLAGGPIDLLGVLGGAFQKVGGVSNGFGLVENHSADRAILCCRSIERPSGTARSRSSWSDGRSSRPRVHSSLTRCPGPSISPRRRPPLWQIKQAPAFLSSAAQRALEPRRARRRARPRAPAPRGARAALGVRGRPPHITVRVFVTRRSVVIVGLTCRRSAALSCRRVFSLLTAARGASPRERASR